MKLFFLILQRKLVLFFSFIKNEYFTCTHEMNSSALFLTFHLLITDLLSHSFCCGSSLALMYSSMGFIDIQREVWTLNYVSLVCLYAIFSLCMSLLNILCIFQHAFFFVMDFWFTSMKRFLLVLSLHYNIFDSFF